MREGGLVAQRRGSSGGGGIGGSTGAADNALLRADGAGGATVQATGITVSDSNQISGGLAGSRPSAGGSTLNAQQSGSVVSLQAAGGADTVTLPAAPTAGQWYDFVIIGADELTIQAQGAHIIRVGTSASTAGGTAKSSTQGSRLHLVYGAANQWFGISSGTWAYA
jgi:hypothetical protein